MACFVDLILGEQQFINAKYPRSTSNPIQAMKNVISLNLQMKDNTPIKIIIFVQMRSKGMYTDSSILVKQGGGGELSNNFHSRLVFQSCSFIESNKIYYIIEM